MKQYIIISFIIASTFSFPHCFSMNNAVAPGIQLIKQLACCSEKGLSALLSAGGKGIISCANYPRLTILISAALLLAIRPIREVLFDYGRRHIVDFLVTRARSVQDKIRSCLLGGLPQLISQTHLSVDQHTEQLHELASSLSIVDRKCDLLQSTMDRVEELSKEQYLTLSAQFGEFSEQLNQAKTGFGTDLEAIKQSLAAMQETQLKQLNIFLALMKTDEKRSFVPAMLTDPSDHTSVGLYGSFLNLFRVKVKA
jgi:hypothetical protein